MHVVCAERQRLVSSQAALAAREVSLAHARIAAVRLQREQLDRARELLEAERKRKLASARARRKPHDQPAHGVSALPCL